MSLALRGMLAAELNINEEKDVFEVEGLISKKAPDTDCST